MSILELPFTTVSYNFFVHWPFSIFSQSLSRRSTAKFIKLVIYIIIEISILFICILFIFTILVFLKKKWIKLYVCPISCCQIVVPVMIPYNTMPLIIWETLTKLLIFTFFGLFWIHLLVDSTFRMSLKIINLLSKKQKNKLINNSILVAWQLTVSQVTCPLSSLNQWVCLSGYLSNDYDS